MTTTTETMTDLIAESVEDGRTVLAKWTPGLHAELIVECDDWVQLLDGAEYWGTTEGDWSVHLVKDAEA